MANDTAPPGSDLSNVRKLLANRRPLVRILGWGSAAALGLAIVAIATQTEPGNERLQLAFAAHPQPTTVVADIPKVDPQGEALLREARAREAQQRLEAQVRNLTSDRDRLLARVASLERSLDDVTGSIKRQAEIEAVAPAAKPAQSNPPPVAQQPAAPPPQQTATPQAPSAAAPAKTEPPVAATADASASVEPKAVATDARVYASEPSPTSQQVQLQTAPPIVENVPLPPVRVAALPSQHPVEVRKPPEVGVDIGGAPNMDVLNLRWAAVKANFGPLLTGMHPLAARVHRPGASDVRLLVGPLPSVAAAAQLCARFAAARIACRPVKFEGEQLAQR